MKRPPREPATSRTGASVPWRLSEAVTGLLVRTVVLAYEAWLHVLSRDKTGRRTARRPRT
ncbi:hypothetical protein ABZX95_42650 [Streptomyces sp. NPDC004232]|uniref:hypothetical protein n=1 Tax=Streptomyces sp. NPDC004232 TaxID=3154454 RepID=UPI0033A84D96